MKLSQSLIKLQLDSLVFAINSILYVYILGSGSK